MKDETGDIIQSKKKKKLCFLMENMKRLILVGNYNNICRYLDILVEIDLGKPIYLPTIQIYVVVIVQTIL